MSERKSVLGMKVVSTGGQHRTFCDGTRHWIENFFYEEHEEERVRDQGKCWCEKMEGVAA